MLEFLVSTQSEYKETLISIQWRVCYRGDLRLRHSATNANFHTKTMEISLKFEKYYGKCTNSDEEGPDRRDNLLLERVVEYTRKSGLKIRRDISPEVNSRNKAAQIRASDEEKVVSTLTHNKDEPRNEATEKKKARGREEPDTDKKNAQSRKKDVSTFTEHQEIIVRTPIYNGN